MAGILTPTDLIILDNAFLKYPPSTAESTYSLSSSPTCIAWSSENNTVFIASTTRGILKFDHTTGSLENTQATHDQCKDPYVSLLCKDRGNTLIYGRGWQVSVLSTQTGKTLQTFETHVAEITSLSLSNDTTLLASTSAHAIHVHNLTLASYTILRGIPARSGTISTCAFHPHSRTRLLVGIGTQLLVYDTTRPSGPAKIIPLDKNVGDIVVITCSPFSKTLVAVGCGNGTIGLVDLEKEKGLFRTMSMPAPLTCLSFSAEGAALYAGTENGKFLILDLRALDKSPKSVTISENGDRIIAISVQKKLKPGEAQVTNSATMASAKPLVQRDTNKTAPGARRIAATSATDAAKKAVGDKAATKPKSTTLTSTASPRRTTVRLAPSTGHSSTSPTSRVVSGTKRAVNPAMRSPTATRGGLQSKAFSPPKMTRDKDQFVEDGDVSVQVEDLLALPKGKGPPSGTIDDVPISAVPLRGISALSRVSSRAQTNESTNAQTASTSSTVTTESVSTGPSRMRSASSSSMASRASKQAARMASTTGASTVSPPAARPRRRVSGTSAMSRMSRTPSPDLPGMDDMGPVTPIPAYKAKGKERAGLSLGTPEIDEWVKAGEGKDMVKDDGAPRGGDGKRVGFAEGSESEAEEERKSDLDPHGRLPRAELAMQVSPRRGFAGAARGSASWAPVPSPLRNHAAPPSPQARAAQDMLQALLRDALHDFRQETKGEIVGLHLDMIRMGAGWRHEMRQAMGEFAGEMRALREENARLREENERLRRGY